MANGDGLSIEAQRRLLGFYRSPGMRCKPHKDVGFSYCNLCAIEVERREIERLTQLLDTLGYCPEHGRVKPCEPCAFPEALSEDT